MKKIFKVNHYIRKTFVHKTVLSLKLKNVVIFHSTNVNLQNEFFFFYYQTCTIFSGCSGSS